MDVFNERVDQTEFCNTDQIVVSFILGNISNSGRHSSVLRTAVVPQNKFVADRPL